MWHCRERAGTKNWHDYSFLLQSVHTQCLVYISRSTCNITTYNSILYRPTSPTPVSAPNTIITVTVNVVNTVAVNFANEFKTRDYTL